MGMIRSVTALHGQHVKTECETVDKTKAIKKGCQSKFNFDFGDHADLQQEHDQNSQCHCVLLFKEHTKYKAKLPSMSC